LDRGAVAAANPSARPNHRLVRTDSDDLTHAVARTLGRMLGATGSSDPVDAHVAFIARQRGWPALTSDVNDPRSIDPTLHLQRI
jgi:hypothetical protein